jgi:uncharacterized membrane protein YkvA (DUF1232 family)
VLARWKTSAQKLKTETYALYLACRDVRTPWYAKVWAAGVLAYAFSPIDLIPDFIPILGYLDDLVLIPLGIWLALKLIPAEVMTEAREKAQQAAGSGKSAGVWGAAIVVFIWLILLLFFGRFIYLLMKH